MIYNVLLEYASGGTLSSLINQSGHSGLPESDVRRYTNCILKGIDYIHTHGYVHCDLKPDNVLLVVSTPKNAGSSFFVPKIGDFGLAKKFFKSNKKMKFDPNIGGTALYMAPETVIDRIQEAPYDIWALGCIVFEMLTWKNVWDWDSKSDMMTTDQVLKNISDGYESPKIPSHLSNDAKDFLKGCLVRKPMFRLTAEMLMMHPFVSGFDETDEILDERWVDSYASTLCNTDYEFYDSSFDDLSFICAKESYPSFSSWSIDVGKNNSSKLHDFLESQSSTSIVIANEAE